MPAVVLIEQRAEKKDALKPRDAYPSDIRTKIVISQIGAVANHTHFIFVYRHVIPVFEWSPPSRPRLAPAAAVANSATAPPAAATGSYTGRPWRPCGP